MKKQIFILALVVLIVLPFVSSETAFYVPQSEQYNIKFSCSLDGNICPSTTICNATITYLQNSTLLLDNNETTNLNNGFFNVTLNSSQNGQPGEYQTHVVCYDTSSGLNDSSTFIYEVNSMGIRPSSERAGAVTIGIWIFAILSFVLFMAFLFVNTSTPVKWTFFLISIIFLLISLNLIFVNIQDQVVNPRLENFFDGFVAISFIMYWFAFGLLAIMWILTFLNTWIYKKNMKNFQRFGG